MSNQNEFQAMFHMLTAAYDSVAEDMARAQRKHFEELVNQGFTEEQALELLKNFDMNSE